MNRCPVALVSEMAEWVGEFFACRRMLMEHGQWPNAGGRLEQSGVFLDLMVVASVQDSKPAYK